MALIELDYAQLKLVQLNEQIELTETFLRLHVQALWHLSMLWQNHQGLLHEYNQARQELQWLRDENRHLMLLLESDETQP